MKTEVMAELPEDALHHMHVAKTRLRYIQQNLKTSKRKTDVDMCTESTAAKFDYTLVTSMKKRRQRKQQQERSFQTRGHQHLTWYYERSDSGRRHQRNETFQKPLLLVALALLSSMKKNRLTLQIRDSLSAGLPVCLSDCLSVCLSV